jgi:hypothetical protein
MLLRNPMLSLKRQKIGKAIYLHETSAVRSDSSDEIVVNSDQSELQDVPVFVGILRRATAR